ncbi:MAG: tRNA (adenosine(37)-N6)-threonylcarbamoyltransferase complex dimerization subunit type 1 TsaB [Deltaproteobacteria bacterium]|nr:tRNA (adenosine(37)-N6)-threonylcarbamoyltransferase complex dimerization subunit type 1 TsaB [Deltaproteobacteria bacterium]
MILAINTSTTQFGLALLKEDETVVAEYLISPGSKNFKNFMPSIHSFLTTSKVDIQDLEAIIVAIGPGSFTGLRVGLATAKGIAQGLQIPIIGVPTLEAMASQLPFTTYPICPMIDSRKEEVFAALFRWGENHKMIEIKEDISLKILNLTSIINDTTLFIGNNFSHQGHMVKKIFGHKALLAPAHLWTLRASAIGSLGMKRLLENNFDDLQDLVPAYLRPPDIRPNPFPLISDMKNTVLKGN